MKKSTVIEPYRFNFENNILVVTNMTTRKKVLTMDPFKPEQEDLNLYKHFYGVIGPLLHSELGFHELQIEVFRNFLDNECLF